MKKSLKPSKFQLLYVSMFLLLMVSLASVSKPYVVPKPNPFAFQSKSNLEFHEISWQYFLWLTEAVQGGKLRFETLYSDSSIDPDNKTGIIGSLAIKSPKDKILGGVNQATSDGILVDQKGRAIYTTIMINDVYRDFVIKNSLYKPEALRNFPDTTNFPIGAFSLKAAWKIVSPGEDASRFYTTTAKIQKLGYNGKKIVLTNVLETARVALVGFHIAVVVKGHPEMIWATFEHVNNAPYSVADQLPGDQVAEGNYTFYKGGTPWQDCNDPASPILKLDTATQKLSPVTQVFRQYRLGGGKSANQNNIDMLNAKMHRAMPRSSVWRNYAEVGAIWFVKKDALKPNSAFVSSDTLLTGSKVLSNSVIETFTQADTDLNQCFGCHNTTPLTTVPTNAQIVPGKNVLTSHILITNYLEKTMQPIK
jgi:hypothetical protein